ncbi:MAG TPA: glycyl-radical enzyme activating protein [Bacteroidales bacterium]|nr:glycyl-radical enzyme activating protein [Bacteroidales bacterium]
MFFKGCPLSCLWCNNPESIDPVPSIMFDERQCHMFGDCIRAGGGNILADGNMLKIDREKISDFEQLSNICPSKALIVVGERKSVSQIISEIEKDIPFYEMSGGGVTLSGGEAFSQDPDLMELVIELKKRNIHVSVETSLHVPWETVEKYLGLIDVFLADLKHTSNEKFAIFTGGNASLVLKNFMKLDKTGKSFIVRVPVIPQFNFSEKELCSIIDFAAGLKNALEINFIPFHSLAKEKYAMLGKVYIFENHRNIEKAELGQYVLYAEKKGMTAKIIN